MPQIWQFMMSAGYPQHNHVGVSSAFPKDQTLPVSHRVPQGKQVTLLYGMSLIQSFEDLSRTQGLTLPWIREFLLPHSHQNRTIAFLCLRTQNKAWALCGSPACSVYIYDFPTFLSMFVIMFLSMKCTHTHTHTSHCLSLLVYFSGETI